VNVPDSIEPVVGWRCWRVLDDRDGFVLASANHPTRWPPGLALEAGCQEGDHAPPASGCGCGVYAARAPELVLRYFSPAVTRAATIITPAILGYDTVLAVGLVSMWGKVVEADLGWRGRYAYPRELLVPAAVKHYRRGPGTRFDVFDSTDLASALGELYGVPAGVTPSVRPRELVLKCA
jgi:hypothetical protein